MTVGVLALQGDFAEHITVIRRLGGVAHEVKNIEDLSKVDQLILPGGESTVMTRLLREQRLDKVIIRRARGGMPILGTCAGAILLSDSHLNLMDISLERNAYGSQIASFTSEIDVEGVGSMTGVFIRAPRIIRTGRGVTVLSHLGDDPILVQQDSLLASTFHPEVLSEDRIHQLFLRMGVFTVNT